MQRRITKVLMFNTLFLFLLVSCKNNSGKNKSEPVSKEQISAEISKNLPEKSNEKVHAGKAVFVNHCLTCHQADGSGVPNMHPPLGPGSWVGKDPKELVAIMMKGLSGKIVVNGEEYKNFMPSHAKLSDQEIADVLSYVRCSFGNNFEPVTAELVAKVRSGK